MEESAVNFTFPVSSSIFSKKYGAVFGSILLTECVIGMFGNLLVILFFAIRLVPFTVFNLLLFNLSLADLLSNVFLIPVL